MAGSVPQRTTTSFRRRNAVGRDFTPGSSERACPALPARCDTAPSTLPLPSSRDELFDVAVTVGVIIGRALMRDQSTI